MSFRKVQGIDLKLPAVRLSFCDALFEAKTFEEGDDPSKAKFGSSFLLNPKKPIHAKWIGLVKAEEQRLIRESWDPIPKDIKLEYCGNGNDRTNQTTGLIYNGYQDMWYITCKSSTAPLVLDEQQRPVASTDKRATAGMYANVLVNLWAQDHPKWGKAIRASVQGVVLLGYGEPFGHHVSADDLKDFDTDDEGLAMADDDDGL